MMRNQNEEYLLKFIAGECSCKCNDELLGTVFKLGVKIQFDNSNAVYQIIDELEYQTRINDIVENQYA